VSFDRPADLLAPGPLADTERAAVVRAVVRCHVLAGLTPPARILWFGSVESARSYADAAVAGDLTGAPEPVRRSGPGPSARVRRALVVPRSAVLWLAVGAGVGLFAAALLIALPFWLLTIGPPMAGFLAVAVVVGRLTGVSERVRSVLVWVALLGFVVTLFALIRWLARFPEGTFLLPEPILRVLLPAVVGVAGLGAAAVGIRVARRRLRAAGARTAVVADVERRLASVPLRTVLGELPSTARVEGWAGQDVLDRVAPGWRPFPVFRVFPSEPSGPGLRRALLRRRLAAVRPAARVLWRAYPGLVVAVEPPRELHSGPSGPDRWDGPALVWADGTAEYFLRGVRVPRSPALGDWSVEEIHAVANSEVRRIMIEAIGWEEYLRAAELELLAEAPDPGNAPHRLELYELPLDVFGPVRLLVMVNGSPDRSGASRRYAEFVPDDVADPVEAAAWQYGVGVDVYRDLQRRT
jgi:hypothetical protein